MSANPSFSGSLTSLTWPSEKWKRIFDEQNLLPNPNFHANQAFFFRSYYSHYHQSHFYLILMTDLSIVISEGNWCFSLMYLPAVRSLLMCFMILVLLLLKEDVLWSTEEFGWFMFFLVQQDSFQGWWQLQIFITESSDGPQLTSSLLLPRKHKMEPASLQLKHTHTHSDSKLFVCWSWLLSSNCGHHMFQILRFGAKYIKSLSWVSYIWCTLF